MYADEAQFSDSEAPISYGRAAAQDAAFTSGAVEASLFGTEECITLREGVMTLDMSDPANWMERPDDLMEILAADEAVGAMRSTARNIGLTQLIINIHNSDDFGDQEIEWLHEVMYLLDVRNDELD